MVKVETVVVSSHEVTLEVWFLRANPERVAAVVHSVPTSVSGPIGDLFMLLQIAIQNVLNNLVRVLIGSLVQVELSRATVKIGLTYVSFGKFYQAHTELEEF